MLGNAGNVVCIAHASHGDDKSLIGERKAAAALKAYAEDGSGDSIDPLG